MTPTLIIFMVLTALSVVPIAAGLRDRDNWAISDVRVFVRFWLPVQIILGLWALAFYELFLCP
jgi:hypothetical protein